MDSILKMLPERNVSYFTVPAAFVLMMVPKYYAVFCVRDLYDPANPRKFDGKVKDAKNVDKITKERVIRANACHSNALETIALYASAVVAGNTAGIPAPTMNALTAGYVASRAAYTVVYVWLQDNRKLAPLRGLAWVTGVGLIMTMFVKAGLKG